MDTRLNLHGSGQSDAVNVPSSTARVETSPAADSQPVRETGDEANLSHASELVAQAIDQPAIRTEKVESIKKQIEAGTYKVDAAEVADALINSALKG